MTRFFFSDYEILDVLELGEPHRYVKALLWPTPRWAMTRVIPTAAFCLMDGYAG
jgi:hypothetical protein